MGQTTLSESLRAVEAEIAAGHAEQALALCQELQSQYPRALAVQRTMGEIYLALRKTREALGALDRALAGNPEDARACCARAIIHQMHGDSLAALAWYRRACDIRPDDQVLRSTYRELSAHLGQPAYEPTRVGLARLYLRGGLFTHAIREWEALIAENPDLLEAHVGLAETLWRAGRTRDAEERAYRIVTNTPSCVKALLLLAVLAHDSGREADALRSAQRARELDPDVRIAQLLFADRLATQDEPLRQLLLGMAPSPANAQRTTGQPVAAAVDVQRVRGVSRPLVQSRPLSTNASARTGATGPLSLPENETARLVASSMPLPQQADSGQNLPPNFHDIFSETEYMIWGPDEETGRLPAMEAGSPAVARPEAPRVEPFARSAQTATPFVPPALMAQSGNLEDTESRAAINWVHWLQAQGAQVLDGGMQSAPMTGGRLGGFDEAQSIIFGGAPTGGLQTEAWTRPTAPQPAHSSEALRSMFAELDPDTTSRHIVEGALVSATDTFEGGRDPAQTHPRDIEPSEPTAQLRRPASPVEVSEGDDGSMPPGRLPLWSESAALEAGWAPESTSQAELAEYATGSREAASVDEAFAVSPESTEEHERHLDVAEAQDAEPAPQPLTLEALEQQFASSGFIRVEPQSGMLASLAPETPPSGGTESLPSSDASGIRAQALAASLAGAGPDASLFVAPDDRPPAEDHPGRLAWARTKRENGQLDTAIGEYRSLLRHAPDLLPDVLSDISEALSEHAEHPELHRLLGDARIRQGDYLGALESYNRAVALTQAQEQ